MLLEQLELHRQLLQTKSSRFFNTTKQRKGQFIPRSRRASKFTRQIKVRDFFSSARVRLRLKFAPLKNLNAISVGLVFRANIPIDVFANQSFIEIGLFHSTECLSQGWGA